MAPALMLRPKLPLQPPQLGLAPELLILTLHAFASGFPNRSADAGVGLKPLPQDVKALQTSWIGLSGSP